MMSLALRSDDRELMDEGGASFTEFHHCLQSLEKINILTLAYRPTLQWLKPVLKEPGKPIHIVDIGCGGGDMLRRIERLARKMNRSVVLTGIDLDPMSRRSAAMMTPAHSAISYISADIFDYKPDKDIDIAICSLFTHHLGDEELVRFLSWLDGNTVQGWFINDLHRHAIPYYFIKWATRIFSRNRLIRNDAPLSVARSFRKQDWRDLLHRAGLDGRPVPIKWHVPFRLCVSCRK